MKKIFLFIILIIFASSLYAVPILSVPKITAPNIDGYVTEWDNALKISEFYNLADKTFIEEKIYVWIGYDEENLYFAYRIYKPTLPKATETDRKSGAFWTDDDIEFFIQPDIKSPAGFQILTNGTGHFSDKCVNNMPQKQLDIVSKAHISDAYNKIGANLEDCYFEGEMSISRESLNLSDNFTWSAKGSFQYQNQTKDYVYCDYEDKIKPNELFLPDKWTKMTLSDSNFAYKEKNKIYVNKDCTGEILIDNRLYKNTDFKKGENLLDIPKGQYVLKVSVNDDNKTIFSISEKVLNVEFFTYKQNKKFIECKLDLTSYKEPQKASVTIFQGEKVFMGYVFCNNKEQNLTFDISKLPKGKYTLLLNIKDQLLKKYEIVI